MSPARPTVQVVGRRMDAEHYRLRDFLTRTAQPYEWHEAGSAEADLLLDGWGWSMRAFPSSSTATGPHGCDRRGGALKPGAATGRAKQHALRLRRHRRRAGGPRGRRLRRLGRPLDARLRPGCARRPGLVRHHDRELLRLSRRDRWCRAGASGRASGGALWRRTDAHAGRPGQSDKGHDEPVELILDDGSEVTASVVLAAPGMDWRGSTWTASTSSSATASTTARAAARRRSARARASWSWAPATRPARPCSTSRTQTARVTMLVRGDRLARRMSAYLIRRIEQHPLIDVHLETQLTELHPNGDKIAAVDLRRRLRQSRDARGGRRLSLHRR